MKEFLKKIGRVIVKSAIYGYCKIFYRTEIIGLENIPQEGPVIVCGNHKSYLDPPLIESSSKRDIRFMAKEELRKNPLFAFLGVVFNGIYVKRDSKDVAAMKTAIKALKDGDCIGIFPEGTRNGLEKGEKVKDGAAFFATRTGAKVVPVGVSGGEKLFDKAIVRYGKPIDYSSYKGKKLEKEELDKITSEIMDNIIELTKSGN